MKSSFFLLSIILNERLSCLQKLTSVATKPLGIITPSEVSSINLKYYSRL